jgi:hypothetical protein
MNPAGYRYPIPQLAMKGTRLQADAPARIRTGGSTVRGS